MSIISSTTSYNPGKENAERFNTSASIEERLLAEDTVEEAEETDIPLSSVSIEGLQLAVDSSSRWAVVAADVSV